jgi:hypothetical protein
MCAIHMSQHSHWQIRPANTSVEISKHLHLCAPGLHNVLFTCQTNHVCTCVHLAHTGHRPHVIPLACAQQAHADHHSDVKTLARCRPGTHTASVKCQKTQVCTHGLYTKPWFVCHNLTGLATVCNVMFILFPLIIVQDKNHSLTMMKCA